MKIRIMPAKRKSALSATTIFDQPLSCADVEVNDGFVSLNIVALGQYGTGSSYRYVMDIPIDELEALTKAASQ
jgi:hypothetical protein